MSLFRQYKIYEIIFFASKKRFDEFIQTLQNYYMFYFSFVDLTFLISRNDKVKDMGKFNLNYSSLD